MLTITLWFLNDNSYFTIVISKLGLGLEFCYTSQGEGLLRGSSSYFISLLVCEKFSSSAYVRKGLWERTIYACGRSWVAYRSKGLSEPKLRMIKWILIVKTFLQMLFLMWTNILPSWAVYISYILGCVIRHTWKTLY